MKYKKYHHYKNCKNTQISKYESYNSYILQNNLLLCFEMFDYFEQIKTVRNQSKGFSTFPKH